MSRTLRMVPKHELYRGPIVLCPMSDSARRKEFTVEILRDSRVTGLRDHKIYRRLARQQLKLDDEDTVRSGKMRRYGTFYGRYEW